MNLQAAVEQYFRDCAAIFSAAYGTPAELDTRIAMLSLRATAQVCPHRRLRRAADTTIKTLAQPRPGRGALIDLSLFRPSSPQPTGAA